MLGSAASATALTSSLHPVTHLYTQAQIQVRRLTHPHIHPHTQDFEQHRQLVMRDFKDCLPEIVLTYLGEKKVSDILEAAIVVGEYILTDMAVFVDCLFNNKLGKSIAIRIHCQPY